MEIGQVYGLNNQVHSAGTAKNEKALNTLAQPRPIESSSTPRQLRLPVADAVREIARSVADYIVTSRLTLDEGYQAFRAELVSNIPLALLSADEMKLIEKLSQDLLDQAAMKPLSNPLDIATTQFSSTSVEGTDERVGVGNVIETAAGESPEQIPEMISPALVKAASLAGTEWQQLKVGPDQSPEAPVSQVSIGSEQRVVMSWTLDNGLVPQGNSVMQTADEVSMPIVLSRSLLGRPVDANSLPVTENSLPGSSATVPVTQLPEEGQSSAGDTSGSSSIAPVIASAREQADPGGPSVASGQGTNSSLLLRMDLKEILGGKPAELRIRHDEALIVSKVAVLLEQMNGLVRVYEEQGRGALSSREKPLSNINPALRQVLALALGIVIDGNKVFSNPASVGVSAGRDGLLALDPALLKSALESHRNEAVTILKTMANSFYDNISLYVDPRILVRFSELLGVGVTDKAERSRKESERRLKKDKELLEKRFLELALILEESGKLRDWFMIVVEGLGSGVCDTEPSDEVVKRALPAVDLAWDQEEFLTTDRSEELKENLTALFVACTAHALQEDDADTFIKLLLKRKILSDKLLAERPDLEPKAAMVCLANEELVMGKIEVERQKLFRNLDELARTTVAARGYRSLFPFPPPMAAFITSEG